MRDKLPRMTAFTYVNPIMFQLLTGYYHSSTEHEYTEAEEAKRDALEAQWEVVAEPVIEVIATPLAEISASFSG